MTMRPSEMSCIVAYRLASTVGSRVPGFVTRCPNFIVDVPWIAIVSWTNDSCQRTCESYVQPISKPFRSPSCINSTSREAGGSGRTVTPKERAISEPPSCAKESVSVVARLRASRAAPPLTREHRVDELALPLALDPLVLDEVRLTTHPELLQHAGRASVARLESSDHAVQPDDLRSPRASARRCRASARSPHHHGSHATPRGRKPGRGGAGASRSRSARRARARGHRTQRPLGRQAPDERQAA